jgi:tetratricopeptide (TPR) repeat protein
VSAWSRAVASLAMLSILSAPLQTLANDGDKDERPSPQSRALAEALFREGKALGESGNITAACLKFEESQRLDPALGTLLHLAACYESEGKTASAWAAFGAAQELAQRAKQRDRAALARQRATELEKKLSRIVISVAQPVDGMTVEMDGRILSGPMLSMPLPLDPGVHVISVEAPGKKSWTAQLDVEQGPTTITLEVPRLEEAVVESPPTAKPRPPEPARAAGEPDSSASTSRIAGFILGGVGLAAIGVGSYFGLRAASQAKDADEHCSGSLCTQEGLDGHDASRTSALIANIGFGVGLAGLGGATFLLLTSNRDGAQRANLRSITADGFHLSARGAW